MHDDYGPSRLGVIATDPSLSPYGGLLEGVTLAKVGLLLFDRMTVANLGRLANLDTGARSTPVVNKLDIDDALRRAALAGELGSDDTLRALLTGPTSLLAIDGTPLAAAALLTAETDDAKLDAILGNYRALFEAGILSPEPLTARQPPGDPISVPDGLPRLDHLLGVPGASEEVIERHLYDLMSRVEDSLRRGTSPSTLDQKVITRLGAELRRTFWSTALDNLPGGTGVISLQPADQKQAILRQDLAGALGAKIVLEALPHIADVPIPDLLVILDDLRSSILGFRRAIRQGSNNLTALDDASFAEYWEDQVRPDLLALDNDLRETRQVGQYLTQLDATDMTAATSSLLLFLVGSGGLASMLVASSPLLLSGARLLVRRQRDTQTVANAHDFYVLNRLRELC